MGDRRELLDSDVELFLAAQKGHQATIWTAMPGIVTKYNAAKMTCEVQPTIKGQMRTPKGNFEQVTMPLLVDCPVCFPNGGGFSLTFPIKPDDECLVVFASRCIDSWWQSGGIQVQAELRMHDLSDGFVIPGPRSLPRVLAPIANENAVQLRSDDGSAFVSIDPNGDINVISPGTIRATADTLIQAQAPLIRLIGNVEIVGNTTISGTLEVAQNTTLGAGLGVAENAVINGAVTVTGLVTANDVHFPGGRTLNNHRHDDIHLGVPGNPPLPGY